jgi:hypothetical protein
MSTARFHIAPADAVVTFQANAPAGPVESGGGTPGRR